MSAEEQPVALPAADVEIVPPADDAPAEQTKEAEEQQNVQIDKDALFKEAMALRFEEPGQAADLFSRVLEATAATDGEQSLEWAKVAYQYGRALFEQARASRDVFGAKLQQEEAGTAREAQAQGQQQQKQAEKQEKGKDEEADEASQGEEDAEDDDEDASSSEEGEGAAEVEADDMAIAWEVLEAARLIYINEGVDRHLSELADIYMALGDLSAEQGNFDSSISDYTRCLDELQRMPQPDTRRIAELHFKMCVPLQLADRLPEALTSCKAALSRMEECRAEIMRVMDTPVEGETGEEADDELEALEKQLDDFNEIIADLKDREEDLQAAIKQQASMKAALASAMRAMAEAAGGAGDEAGAAGVGIAADVAAAAGLAPPSGNAFGAARTLPTAPVQDLGVAGRGRARITLQPQRVQPQQQPAAQAQAPQRVQPQPLQSVENRGDTPALGKRGIDSGDDLMAKRMRM